MRAAEKLSVVNNSMMKSHEGGLVYKADLKHTLAEFFSLGMLNGKFYQSQEEVLRDAGELFARALDECPLFATQCAIYGRVINNLRLVPTMWLVYLSTLENKDLFRKAFPRIIHTIDQLYDFMEMCRKGGVRGGLGRGVKKVVSAKLIAMLNEYQACRYRNTIAEIARVVRPTDDSERFQTLMKYIIKGETSFPRVRTLKKVLEDLESGNVESATLAYIEGYDLQLEELKPALGALDAESKKKVYSVLFKRLNYGHTDLIEY